MRFHTIPIWESITFISGCIVDCWCNCHSQIIQWYKHEKWIASRLNKNQIAPIDAVDYFAINIVKSTIWCSKYSIYQDLAPKARLIFSNESQNVNDQGAIRNQHGRNPLYNAKNPSLCIVFARQSIELLYTRPEKCQNNINAFMIIQLVTKIKFVLQHK